MEILDPLFYHFALIAGLVLTIACAVLLLVITGIHFRTDQKRTAASKYNRTIKPLVKSYLEGNSKVEIVIEAMQQKPLEAFAMLMELSLGLDPAKRSRLEPLFAGLPLIDSEIEALASPHLKRRIQAAERLGHYKNEFLEIDHGLLSAILRIPKYEHGARSFEKIV